MAELVVKKWQLGRVLTAKKHVKSHVLRIQTYVLRIQSRILRIQSRFTYPNPQVSALPRTGNTITAMQKQYYRSSEMKCPRCGNLYELSLLSR